LSPPQSGRERIRRDHAELHRRLEEIELLLGRWEAGAATAGLALRNRGLALYERLRHHIDMEERILAPALFESGEDGEERALELAAEHRQQRDLLAFLQARMSALRPTVLVARELRTFAAYLREDMAREERMLEELGKIL
jgi:hemerythrin-like domain-containing protein